MSQVVILAAGRTAIGAFNGSLKSVPAAALGAAVIKGLVDKVGLKGDAVDEVILGHVLQAGTGQCTARQAALLAGLPETVPCMAINKVCGSGLKAVHLAAQAIKCGDADIVIAGGHESMSMSPHIVPNSRDGQRMGDWKMQDSMVKDGLWCAFNNYHMGQTAENLAERYEISRERQDAFAAQSQQRAEAALAAGVFDSEIIPVEVPGKKGSTTTFAKDEYPKAGVTAEGLAKLRPAFSKTGSVTAANASGINDGAAALVVSSAAKAAELGVTPMARVVAYASAGIDPAIMGAGPVPATKKCLEKAGWSVSDLDLIEANEAFAVQALTVGQELGFDPSIVNVNGGAIALGHPIGASGARVLVSLLHEMVRRDAKKGLATLCIGGGQGVAIAVERD